MRTSDSEVLIFAGLNPRDDVSLSAWWESQMTLENDGHLPEAIALRDAIRRLPRAMETDVSWRHPGTGDWFQTSKHHALIDPDQTSEIQPDHSNGEPVVESNHADMALWHIPTSDYEIINPAQFLDPLGDAIDEQGMAQAVFGRFELYRRGGRVRGDVYFDTHTIDLAHIDSDPIMLGIEVGWDFFGGIAAYAQGLGMDTGCINSMRRLTDRITVRHQGDVEDRIDFWDDLLRRIDLVADHLTRMIAAAEDTSLEIRELPFGLQACYELLGFPTYLADRAVDDVRANAFDPFEPTLWELHSGATYAITHHARGSADSIQQYHRRANDLLMNPALVIDRIHERFEEEQIGEGGDQMSAGANNSRATIADLSGSLEEKRQIYQTRQEEIKALFERA